MSLNQNRRRVIRVQEFSTEHFLDLFIEYSRRIGCLLLLLSPCGVNRVLHRDSRLRPWFSFCYSPFCFVDISFWWLLIAHWVLVNWLQFRLGEYLRMKVQQVQFCNDLLPSFHCWSILHPHFNKLTIRNYNKDMKTGKSFLRVDASEI